MEGVMRKGEIKQSSSEASILPSLTGAEPILHIRCCESERQRIHHQFSHSVILANAGIYCIASAVARFYRFITGISVDLATLLPRHPRERGDPSYSERRGTFLSFYYRCCWFFSYCLWR